MIKIPHNTKHVFALRLVCAAILLAAILPTSQTLAQRRDRGPTLVRTGTVVEKDSSQSQVFVGSLRPVRRSVIGSAVDGRIDEVYIEEGDFVARDASAEKQPQKFVGEPMVQVLTETLDIEIKAAEIELALRNKVLEELEKTIPQEIELAQANTAQAKAQKEYAEKLYARAMELAGDRGISQKELEESDSTYRSQTQAYLATAAELRRLESTKQIRLTIAQKRISSQQSELERLADLRSRYTIRAPFPGFVTRKMVERGTWVTRGTPVAEVIQLNPIELRVNVPQEYMGQLQHSFDAATESEPFTAMVTINSLEQSFLGTIERIIPEADQRTRSLPVVIRVENPTTPSGFLLKSGLLARASLPVGESARTLMVHKDALVFGQQEIAIFVLQRKLNSNEELTPVRRVIVQTASAMNDLIEISGDVQEGDEVVTQGNERLRNGQEVKVIKDGEKKEGI